MIRINSEEEQLLYVHPYQLWKVWLIDRPRNSTHHYLSYLRLRVPGTASNDPSSLINR